MTLLAILVAAQTVAQADTVPPYLAFPQPGLDDPAAYEGYKPGYTRMQPRTRFRSTGKVRQVGS